MKSFSPPIRHFARALSLFTFLCLAAIQAPDQSDAIPILIWIIIILVILFLIWYGLRALSAPPAAPENLSLESQREGRATIVSTPDDLIIIEGIGPKIASVLRSAGINTFNELASTDVNRLRQILDEGGVRLADPETWPEQARLAARGDQQALKDYQDRLKGGRAA